MPKGKGTYGKKVGRPPKKKKMKRGPPVSYENWIKSTWLQTG